MSKATLVRRQPRRPQTLRDPFFGEMDRFLGNTPFWAGNLFGHALGEGLGNAWVPPVDVQETENILIQ